MDAKGLSHIYTCIHSSPNSPPIQAATEHWAEFLGLYSRSLLVIHFKYSSVYMCYFSQVKKTLTINWPWWLRSEGNLTMEGLPSPFPGPVLHWLSWKWKWKWSRSVVSNSLQPHRLTIAYQAPPSMGFSRQEYWSGLPLPSPDRLS